MLTKVLDILIDLLLIQIAAAIDSPSELSSRPFD